MTPSNCGRCRRLFETSLALQAEARHVASVEGPVAAERWLNERMLDQHETHSGEGEGQ